MRIVFRFLVSAAVLLTAGCGFVPEKVSFSDPRVTPLLQAATNFDRAAYGFTTIPTSGGIRLESRPRWGYDAMLHFDGETSRTIAFSKAANAWTWIHEQEIFTGPNLFTNVDGVHPEEITLTYGIESISGNTPKELLVQYSGEDPRLTTGSLGSPPTLPQVRPILEEWKQKRERRSDRH